MLHGRITESCEAPSVEHAERTLRPSPAHWVLGDDDWWSLHYRRRLLASDVDTVTNRERAATDAYAKRVNEARIRRKLAQADARIARQTERYAKWESEREAVMARGRAYLAVLDERWTLTRRLA